MLTRTMIICQLVPKLIPEDIECRLHIRACLDYVIYVLHVFKFNLMTSSYNENIYLQEIDVIL